jgi:hypothetical protein
MEGKHDLLQEDENDVKKSTSGITTEEVEATSLKHDEGMSATTTISRHALCLLALRCMLIVYKFYSYNNEIIAYQYKSVTPQSLWA